MSFLDKVDLSKMIYIEGGHEIPSFNRNDFLTLDQVNAYRQHHQNKGLYLTAYLYNDYENLEESLLYGDFYLDFDSEEDIQLAQKDAVVSIWYMKQKFKYDIPDTMFRIYFSGSKGFHVVVPASILHVRPDVRLNEYYKLMAKDISQQTPHGTIDTKIYDRRRLFRMINSMHPKTGLYKVPLSYHELCTLTVDEIKEKAKAPYTLDYEQPHYIPRAAQEYESYISKFKTQYEKMFDNHRRNQDRVLNITPHCVQELIDQGPSKGNRNQTAAVLTSFFSKRGMSEQEIWDNLMEWYNKGPSNDFKPSEIKRTMESILKKGAEYGCSTLSSISTCIGAECPLFKPQQ